MILLFYFVSGIARLFLMNLFSVHAFVIMCDSGGLAEWDRSVSRLPPADRRAILTLVAGL